MNILHILTALGPKVIRYERVYCIAIPGTGTKLHTVIVFWVSNEEFWSRAAGPVHV